MRSPQDADGPAAAGTTRLTVRCVLALVFGMALAMSFAPARAWWFAPYCVAGLLYLLDLRWRGAALVGGCFGLGWFGAGFWWILPALDGFSDAGTAFSFQLTVALVAYMSLFPACAAILVAHCRRVAGTGLWERWGTALRIALVFALMEWARGVLFGGFPMLATGYAHADGPLAGYAPLVGVNGLGFLNALVAALLAGACWQPRARQRLRLWGETVALIALVLVGGALLEQVDWAEDTGRTLSVSLLQGNLAQSEKFSDAGLARAAATYLGLASVGQGRLTVLPETALPVEWSMTPPDLAADFQRIADARATTIVIGAVTYHPGQGVLKNSAVALHPHQQARPYRYDKHHLVPLSESLPPGTGWIGRRLGMGFNGLAAGPADQAPLDVAGARVGVSICFESMFDTALARRAGEAEVLLNLTNFAWTTGSYAAVQHLQIAQMRALETARWFIQASNTGMTALVDDHGRIRKQLAPDETGVLDGEVRLLTGRTPFMVLGNWPLLGAAALAGLWSLLANTPQHRCRKRLLSLRDRVIIK